MRTQTRMGAPVESPREVLAKSAGTKAKGITGAPWAKARGRADNPPNAFPPRYRGGKLCVLELVGGVGLEPTTSRV